MNQIDLSHRHAVVTGGAQGIGLSIAARLVASGASVSLWDRDEELLSIAAKHLGNGKVVSVEAIDVSDPAGVAAATAAAIEKHGKIDILVANAGIAGPNHTTWEYPIATWKQVIDINLVGVFLCCHAIVPHMLCQGYGRIVNVASIAGKEGNPNLAAYSASKAGLIGLTRALALEIASRNITVNAVAPGFVVSPMTDPLPQNVKDALLARVPLGRMGKDSEVAAAIVFLASEEAGYITGAVVPVDGGLGMGL